VSFCFLQIDGASFGSNLSGGVEHAQLLSKKEGRDCYLRREGLSRVLNAMATPLHMRPLVEQVAMPEVGSPHCPSFASCDFQF
jgi:hypothetical protein